MFIVLIISILCILFSLIGFTSTSKKETTIMFVIMWCLGLVLLFVALVHRGYEISNQNAQQLKPVACWRA